MKSAPQSGVLFDVKNGEKQAISQDASPENLAIVPAH
jgi:hypothetical protein